jgi:general L-amino acid transport system permease protein
VASVQLERTPVAEAELRSPPGAQLPAARMPATGSPRRRRYARIRHAALHGAVVIIVIGLVVFGLLAIRNSLAGQGIGFSFSYLSRASDFNISEGVAPSWADGHLTMEAVSSTSSNAAMLVAGLFNSVKVALLAIVLSTVVGVVFGIARLSTNWLARNTTFAIVEFVRNTPLLIQLVFWYFAVLMRLPAVTGAANAYSWLLASRSGVFVPVPILSEGAGPLSLSLLGCGVVGLAFACWPRLSPRLRIVFVVGGLALVAGSCAAGFPITLDWPMIGRFGPSGGFELSPEMSAILLAITINSSAYIAEIVRGAIEALPKGQWEAASSLGMPRADTLSEVILPQVFRIVLPSLGNRYISLTKDTSLGIAIGFPDLFNVSGTVANQTGRNLETVLIVMTTYLLLSWSISLVMNMINNRLIRAGAGR